MANRTPKKKVERIGALIVTKRGNVSAIARTLKMQRSTLNNYINADPELKQALADERERMLDNAEDKLGLAINKGEAWAICFTLKTQGQERGYIEKQKHEHSGPNDGPIQAQIIINGVPGNSEPSTNS